MPSRKNRSRKANRRSPQPDPTLRERLQQRLSGLIGWFHARRWYAYAAAAVLLFGASLVGGYWLAQRLEMGDGDRLARDTLEEMKRSGPAGSATEPAPRYARIEDLPDLPKYTEVEPGQPRCRPRPPALQARVGAAGTAHPVVPALCQGAARAGQGGARQGP